jgi:hypothetical protein
VECEGLENLRGLDEDYAWYIGRGIAIGLALFLSLLFSTLMKAVPVCLRDLLLRCDGILRPKAV